ncbi:uncharacterized protein RSE6_09593 [Rhynchosporium secalis]|uniref:Uncharacterized protein n=1 Tax=Rhynchosporium secalis TaxID=38038 RepID=A0A1E1MID0_RHYSE|nr:uncharacterized protein RSE6_09593 [Rhynchosporium secalis]
MSDSNSGSSSEEGDAQDGSGPASGYVTGYGPEESPRDINQTLQLDLDRSQRNPHWMWLSHQRISAKRFPVLEPIENRPPLLSNFAQIWLEYTNTVLATLAIKNNVDLPASASFPRAMPLMGDGTPIDMATSFIVPGDFWIGMKGLYMRLQAGVFVVFRREGHPQKNAWWWEIVHANLDKRGRVL